MTKNFPTIALGNPLIASCDIGQLSDNAPATGLTVTAFIGAKPSSTDAIDGLTVTAVERGSDASETTRAYDATFTGNDITQKLSAYNGCSVWLIFVCPDNNFRLERECLVIPGQSG